MNNHNDEAERRVRLRAMLLEDTGSSEDADALLEAIARLDAWRAPKPTDETTARLVKTLLPSLPRRRTRTARRLAALASWWPLLVLRAQMRVVRGEIWAASALVMALGTLVTLTTFGAASTETFPLVLLAPVVTAIGVAFLYGPDVDPALEIQLATPASPRLLLLARLLLLFGYDLVFGLVGSAALVLLQTDISLWPLVMTWLAPMTFLSAMAFLLSVLFKDPLIGVMASTAVWSFHAVTRLADLNELSIFAAVPNLAGEAARPWLWLLGVLMGVAALWLAGREEQWIKGWLS